MKLKLIKRRLSAGDIYKEETKKDSNTFNKKESLEKQSSESVISSPISSPDLKPRSRTQSLDNVGAKTFFKSPKFLRRKKDDWSISNANLVSSTYTGNFEPLYATLERKRRGELIDDYSESRALKNELLKNNFTIEVQEQKILEDVKEEDLDALKEFLSEFVDINDNIITCGYDNFTALPSPNLPNTPSTTPVQYMTNSGTNNLSSQSSLSEKTNIDDTLIDKLLTLKKDKETIPENLVKNNSHSKIQTHKKVTTDFSGDCGINGIKITINDGERFENEFTYTSKGLSRSGSVDSLLNEMDVFITQSVSDEIERDFSVRDKTKIMEYTITGKISQSKDVYKNYIIDKKIAHPLTSNTVENGATSLETCSTKLSELSSKEKIENKKTTCENVDQLRIYEKADQELQTLKNTTDFPENSPLNFSEISLVLKQCNKKKDFNGVKEFNDSDNRFEILKNMIKMANDKSTLKSTNDEETKKESYNNVTSEEIINSFEMVECLECLPSISFKNTRTDELENFALKLSEEIIKEFELSLKLNLEKYEYSNKSSSLTKNEVIETKLTNENKKKNNFNLPEKNKDELSLKCDKEFLEIKQNKLDYQGNLLKDHAAINDELDNQIKLEKISIDDIEKLQQNSVQKTLQNSFTYELHFHQKEIESDQNAHKLNYSETEPDINVSKSNSQMFESDQNVPELNLNTLDLKMSSKSITNFKQNILVSDLNKSESELNVPETNIKILKPNFGSETDIKLSHNVILPDLNMYQSDLNMLQSNLNVSDSNFNVPESDLNVTESNKNAHKTDHNILKVDQHIIESEQNIYELDQKIDTHLDYSQVINVTQLKNSSVDESIPLETSSFKKIAYLETLSIEEPTQLMTSSFKENTNLKTLSVEVVTLLETPSNEEISQLETPSIEGVTQLEIPSSEEIMQLESSSVEKDTQLETLSNKELTQLEMLSIKEITQLEILSNEEIAQLESSSVEEVTQLETLSNKEVTQLEILPNEKVTLLKTSSNEETMQLKTPSNEEVTQLETPSNEEVTQLEISLVEEVTQLETPSIKEATQLKSLTVKKVTQLETFLNEKVTLLETSLIKELTQLESSSVKDVEFETTQFETTSVEHPEVSFAIHHVKETSEKTQDEKNAYMVDNKSENLNVNNNTYEFVKDVNITRPGDLIQAYDVDKIDNNTDNIVNNIKSNANISDDVTSKNNDYNNVVCIKDVYNLRIHTNSITTVPNNIINTTEEITTDTVGFNKTVITCNSNNATENNDNILFPSNSILNNADNIINNNDDFNEVASSKSEYDTTKYTESITRKTDNFNTNDIIAIEKNDINIFPDLNEISNTKNENDNQGITIKTTSYTENITNGTDNIYKTATIESNENAIKHTKNITTITDNIVNNMENNACNTDDFNVVVALGHEDTTLNTVNLLNDTDHVKKCTNYTYQDLTGNTDCYLTNIVGNFIETSVKNENSITYNNTTNVYNIAEISKNTPNITDDLNETPITMSEVNVMYNANSFNNNDISNNIGDVENYIEYVENNFAHSSQVCSNSFDSNNNKNICERETSQIKSQVLSRKEALLVQLLEKLAAQRLCNDIRSDESILENIINDESTYNNAQPVPERKYKMLEKRSKTFDASNKEIIQKNILLKLKKSKKGLQSKISSAKSFDYGSNKYDDRSSEYDYRSSEPIYENEEINNYDLTNLNKDNKEHEYVNEKAKKISDIAFVILKTCRENEELNESDLDDPTAKQNNSECNFSNLLNEEKQVIKDIEDEIVSCSVDLQESNIDFSKMLDLNMLDEETVHQNSYIVNDSIAKQCEANPEKLGQDLEVNLTKNMPKCIQACNRELVHEDISSPKYLDYNKVIDFSALKTKEKQKLKLLTKAKSFSNANEPISEKENHGVYKLSDYKIEEIFTQDNDILKEFKNDVTNGQQDDSLTEDGLGKSELSKCLHFDEDLNQVENSGIQPCEESNNFGNCFEEKTNKRKTLKFSRPSLDSMLFSPGVTLQNQVLQSIQLDNESKNKISHLIDDKNNNDPFSAKIFEVTNKKQQSNNSLENSYNKTLWQDENTDFNMQVFSSTIEEDDLEYQLKDCKNNLFKINETIQDINLHENSTAYVAPVSNVTSVFHEPTAYSVTPVSYVTSISKQPANNIGTLPDSFLCSESATTEQRSFKSKITFLPTHHVKNKNITFCNTIPKISNTTSTLTSSLIDSNSQLQECEVHINSRENNLVKEIEAEKTLEKTLTESFEKNKTKSSVHHSKNDYDSNLSIQLKSVNQPQKVTVELKSSWRISNTS
ncbi:MATH and LRR domain-containing protein PFE0570w [Hydra vulgaris]|uniref:MATH and LRR domain-containing protein PFE0570w n=1 Tax=Hydra vulgaris TaxID=6087 RepID=A0ABM4BF09_HYDVU